MKWYSMKAVVAVIIACFLVASCSSSKASKVEKPKMPKFEQQVKWNSVWKANGGQGLGKIHLGLSPALVSYKSNSWVVAADYMGTITVIDASTGKRVWREKTDTEASSNVGETNDAIVFGTQDGEVIALSKEDGHELWRGQVSSTVLAAPTGRSDYLVALSIDSQLHGLNATTGEQLWLFDATAPSLMLRGGANPLLISDNALVGFSNGQLGLFGLNNGTVEWIQPIALPRGRSEIQRMVDINGRMERRGDTAYVATFHGKLAAVDLIQRRFLWTRDISSYQGLTVTTREVIVTDADSNVTAYDRYTGDTLWTQAELQRRYLTAPVVFDNYVIVADVYGYVFALSRQTGQLMGYEKLAPAAIRVAPLVDNEGIIIQNHTGRIFKVRPVAKG